MVIVALYQKYTNHSLFVNIVYVFKFLFFLNQARDYLVGDDNIYVTDHYQYNHVT